MVSLHTSVSEPADGTGTEHTQVRTVAFKTSDRILDIFFLLFLMGIYHFSEGSEVRGEFLLVFISHRGVFMIKMSKLTFIFFPCFLLGSELYK